MMRMIAAMALIVAGCAPMPDAPDNPPAPAPSPDILGGCDATKAAKLLGKPGNEANGAAALKLTGARTLRRIPPNTAVTMDYRTDRLNLYVDDKGIIFEITCG